MRKSIKTLTAFVLLLTSLVGIVPFGALASCNHKRYCHQNTCMHCGELYTGSNYEHLFPFEFEYNDAKHWRYCYCGEEYEEEGHWTFCCEPDSGCFNCYYNSTSIYIVHHMWETDDGIPFCCCGERGVYPGDPADRDDFDGDEDNIRYGGKSLTLNEKYMKDMRQFRTVAFGSYEQDNNASNGPEAIEWIVLYSDDEKALLLSRLALTRLSFNQVWTQIKWENSTIRSWLNNNFYYPSFTEEEKNKILTSNGNAWNEGYGVIATSDPVFLLSLDEVNTYLPTAMTSRVLPTAYAKANGIPMVEGFCWWWLRSSGASNKVAQFIMENGYASTIGRDVSSSFGGVRPAIWVDVSVIQ